MNIRTLITERAQEAMSALGIAPEFAANVAQSKNPAFGDYQINGAMAAAKSLQRKPRELAQQIVEHLHLDGIADKIEVAGPGFINIHLRRDWMSELLKQHCDDSHLGASSQGERDTVVVDYSSPNLAKEMHVGHLRSTIIGDACARILEFVGDRVIRQNHVGDWGTQFGMLIAELESHLQAGEQAELALKDLEVFYQQAKLHFDSDGDFAERARNYVVRLQGGDRAILQQWQKFREISLSHSEEVYRKLNVKLQRDDVRGESAYNDALAPLLAQLQSLGLVQEDQGAQVIFLPEISDREGKPSPVIVQKKDGGFLYASTDLAAIKFRVQELGATRLLYFIDDRQSLHMQQVFTVARKAGFVSDAIGLEHKAFGKMLGKDGKPFKTRSGGTVKLAELLDEAVDKAASVVREKNPSLDGEELHNIARVVGIGAVKYADLSKTRTLDYVFDWDSMLSFEGNTGPYLQYAYARIASIFRKAGVDMENFSATVSLQDEAEQALALKALQFPELVEQVAKEVYPHVLCTYLYELASVFMQFYERCPILKDDVAADIRQSRLQLSKFSASIIKTGLDLLGIEVLDRM